MKIASSMDELVSQVDDAMRTVLRRDIATGLIGNLYEHVIRDVYGGYNPKMYQRRYSDGGMEDIGYIRSEFFHDRISSTLLVQDRFYGNKPWAKGSRVPKPGHFAEIINDGLQGAGGGLWKDAVPRPYVDNAREDAPEITMQILNSKFDHV